MHSLKIEQCTWASFRSLFIFWVQPLSSDLEICKDNINVSASKVHQTRWNHKKMREATSLRFKSNKMKNNHMIQNIPKLAIVIKGMKRIKVSFWTQNNLISLTFSVVALRHLFTKDCQMPQQQLHWEKSHYKYTSSTLKW